MDPKTRIPVSISRTYSGIVPFWKMENFRNTFWKTGKIQKHVPETGKICALRSGNRKISVTRSRNRKISVTRPRNRKISVTRPRNRKISVTRPRNRKNFQKMFWKLEKFSNYSIDTVRDWLWILVALGWNWFIYKNFRSRTNLWILKCVPLYVQYIFLFTWNQFVKTQMCLQKPKTVQIWKSCKHSQ